MIRFTELVEETETFDFQLEDAFFQMFESNDWESGKVNATVLTSKRADGVTLDITLNGILTVSCDRCLEPFSMKVDDRQQIYVKYGHEELELDDNVIVVSKEENQINLGSLFYDYLVLSIPVTKVHPEDANGQTLCNLDMIEKLEKHIVTTEQIKEDPRWDDLKKLLDKN